MTKDDQILDIQTIYFKEIKEISLLTQYQLEELLKEVRKGNKEARNKIIEANLRLVSKVAYHYQRYSKTLTILDLIQEGSFGLIKAIEKYDAEKGSFSNYAIKCIKGYIKRGMQEKEDVIGKPEHFVELQRKYKKLIQQSGSLTDDDIKQKLGIKTDEILENLKTYQNANISSLNAENNDINEKEKTIQTDNPIENLLEDLDQFDYLNVIQSILTPKEYYILYYRIIKESKTTQKFIAKKLGTTQQNINSIEKKIYKKIQPYVRKESIEYKKTLKKLKTEQGKLYYRLKITPLEPDDILTFLYIKNNLTTIERQVLYLTNISRYQYIPKEIQTIVNISEKEYKIILQKIQYLIKKKQENPIEYETWKENIMKTYRSTSIYKMQLLNEEEKIKNYKTKKFI